MISPKNSLPYALHHSKVCQPNPPNFLDRKDAQFKKLHSTCDVVFRSLHESGVGAQKNSAPPVTKEDENKLWDTGVLNITTPNGLQRAVFLHWQGLLLEGGEEQRKLKPSQFIRLHNPKRYEYTEHGSKTGMEGFINCKWRTKVFPFSKMMLQMNAV